VKEKRNLSEYFWSILLSTLNEGFFSSNFLCSQTANCPQKDLAKFGYGPDVKVENSQNSFICWIPAGNCWNLL
jgi:hypothetical protein